MFCSPFSCLRDTKRNTSVIWITLCGFTTSRDTCCVLVQKPHCFAKKRGLGRGRFGPQRWLRVRTNGAHPNGSRSINEAFHDNSCWFQTICCNNQQQSFLCETGHRFPELHRFPDPSEALPDFRACELKILLLNAAHPDQYSIDKELLQYEGLQAESCRRGQHVQTKQARRRVETREAREGGLKQGNKASSKASNRETSESEGITGFL